MYIILRELIEDTDTEAREQNLSLPFEKEHSKNQKEPLEIKNLRIQMLTEGLEEKVE